MPTVQKTSGGRVSVRGIGEFELGDEADVSTADAEYLVKERGDFEIVDADDGDSDVTGSDDGDADGHVDSMDVGFDADAWLDQSYTDREQAVRDGEVDEHLGKIKHVETSDTVKNAVDDRLED